MESSITRPESPITRYEQIGNRVRCEILNNCTAGQLLVSERELSKKYSASRSTIRKALDLLVDEGLVERKHRLGNVVTDPLAQGEFAIVIRPGLLRAESSPAYRQIASLLSEKMGTKSDQWHVKLHLGKKVDSELYAGQLFPGTLDLLEPDTLKKLLGVFSFHPLYEFTKLLRQKNIPIMRIGKVDGEDIPAIFLDWDGFFKESVDHLCHVGCRSVGFIWSHFDKPLTPEQRYDSHFAKHAIEAGLTVKENWLPAVLNEVTERKAYDTFVKFWQQGDCPDGLVISDDVIAKGVLRAVLHKNIRVPEQMRLITYANKGIELPFHKPVTRYECDMEKTASLATEAMIELLNGHECEQNIHFPGELIKGQTT